MADYIGATPQVNPLMGLLAERLKQAQQFAAKPFGYQNPPAEMLMNLLGVPAVQQTAERLAYGEPLTTGRGMTTQVRPEALEAALTVAPVAGLLGKATKGMPGGLSIKPMDDMVSLLTPKKSSFDVARRDASDIFGAGAERVKYTDPNSGGVMEVLAKPDGSASVLSLEVPETARGKGIGQSLQAQVMQDFPEMMGQVSSKAAAKTAYRIGRRPPNEPNATLDDVYSLMDENSSVNLVSPEMQKKLLQESGLLGQQKVAEPTDLLSYRGSHTAPGPDFGAPLYDLTGGGQMYPADVYSSKAAQYYGTGYQKADKEAFALANKVKGNPDAEVMMYRAVPKDASIENINTGDWVTLSKDYAKNHGESVLDNDYKIISKKVKAKDLWTNADSIHEFGYWPE